MQLSLTIEHDGNQETRVIDTFPAVFGRGDECFYRLDHSSISRTHFLIEYENDKFSIQDLQSTNGTYVNGKEIVGPTLLQDQDVIKVTKYSLQVSLLPVSLHSLVSPMPSRNYEVTRAIKKERQTLRPTDTFALVETCCDEFVVAGALEGLATTSLLNATRAKLYQNHKALKILYLVMEACNEEPEYGVMVERLLYFLCQTIGADRGMIAIRRNETDDCVKKIFAEKELPYLPIYEPILDEVMKTAKQVISHRPLEDKLYRGNETTGAESLICAPLISYKRVFGAVYLDRVRANVPAFTEENLELLSAVGMSVGNTLEKSFLVDELKKTNKSLEVALAKLNEAQQQVIQQERLRAMGEMACGIAHDFNNVLEVIIGYSDLLLLQSPHSKDEQTMRRYQESINVAAKDGANIVMRLRELYRSRKGEVVTDCDLNRVVEQAVLLSRPRWNKQQPALRIEMDLGPGPVSVSGDESALRQAVLNLIFNAVDAMPSGGVIRIRTFIENDRAILQVADTGTGMTEEVQQKCLSPFFTTKTERGTGLGLSIVSAIVERYHGSINIRSEPGKGSIFNLVFPKSLEYKPK